MRMRFATVLLMGALLSHLSITTARAGKLYWHHQGTCNKHCVPIGNYGHDSPIFGTTRFAVANAPIGIGTYEIKPFHFRSTAMVIDQLQLDRVGMALYKKDGKIVATGRILHNGGDGGIAGNNVTIRLRAYVASMADSTQIPPDAHVVWESERHIWIPRDHPQFVSLVPQSTKSPQSEELMRHYNSITHLEVELEYSRDR